VAPAKEARADAPSSALPSKALPAAAASAAHGGPPRPSNKKARSTADDDPLADQK
jgi:hypothetical protein